MLFKGGVHQLLVDSRDFKLNGGTNFGSLKPIPMSKVISDKKPLILQFSGKLSDHRFFQSEKLLIVIFGIYVVDFVR